MPKITPARVIAGLVIVGEWARSTDPGAGSSAFASPKSSTLTTPSARSLDIGRLQIAMDDPSLVRGLESLGDLYCNR